MKKDDEFYVGWEEKSPPQLAKRVRWWLLHVFLLAVGVSAVLAVSQRTIETSIFEWGQVRSFSGTLVATPFPQLLVLRPGAPVMSERFSQYTLVNEFKFGIDRETLARFDGKSVDLRGTLIYRDGHTMIEVVPGSIRVDDRVDNRALASEKPSLVKLGYQRLSGEIVDSKCYLGVMNPGAFTAHRGCAIRCLSGGVPPIFLVRRENGVPLVFYLVSADDAPLVPGILERVAEPVTISGEVERLGGLLVIRANLTNIVRTLANR